MSDFKFHTPETVPEAARDTLDRVEKSAGMIPNLAWIMAEAPALIKGYFTLNDLFEESSFSASECQIISLCISHWNQCHYCVPAHSFLARQAHVATEVVAAIREDRPIPEERLEALRRFIYTLLEKRGWVEESDLQDFYNAGFTQRNVLEVILGIGLNTLSNYTNHIAKTPVDEAFTIRFKEIS